MKTLSGIPNKTFLANTYDNGKTVTFYRKLKNTKPGIKVFDYEFEEIVTLAGDPTVNSGFYHSNYFTIENKPDLFKTFKAIP